MLMTTERVKQLLKITDTTYDADIALYEPIAEDRLNFYLGYTLSELTLGYEPYYARLVWTFIAEGTTSSTSQRVIKSESFDGASMTYETTGSTEVKGVAENTDDALAKFNPLRTRYY